MTRIIYEFTESFRIAFAQIRANKMRSFLTALGVIIGIVAVTLMGTAINGIDIGFDRSLAMLGEDVLYVEKWPWRNVEDWWNYQNRPPIFATVADRLNRVIEQTPNSLLKLAVPVATRNGGIKVGGRLANNVQILGTTAEYGQITTADCNQGRLFSEIESNGGRQVIVLGGSVCETLFPEGPQSAIGQTVDIRGQHFTVVGVMAKQGDFLGNFSQDNKALIPLNAMKKFYGSRIAVSVRVKINNKLQLKEAEDELTGAMRRVRSQLPAERDNFSINEQEGLKAQLDPAKNMIAIAGLFITGLSLFVGAIGIMNITFVSVKERTKEIGTRKALGARRRTILLQFLIEAVSICLIGGLIGLALTFSICLLIGQMMPALPVVFSMSLVAVSMAVSVVTGIFSGFAPAWGASRLDPVVALRYE